MTRPLKRYSQHFLINPHYPLKIVEALNIQPDDWVLEIGPGKGALTRHIVAAQPRHFFAVEIDQQLAQSIRNEFGPKVDVIGEDFINFNLQDPNRLEGKKYKVIGNLPYHITSPILFKLIDNYQWIDLAVLMMQKEVAQRLIAVPGNKDYGILSVVSQTYSKVEYLFEVRRGNFYPVPQVDSAVLRLSFYQTIGDIDNEPFYRHLVRVVFNQRRKMLRNSLSRILQKSIVYSLTPHFLDRRPEELTVEEFKSLANELYHISGAFDDSN